MELVFKHWPAFLWLAFGKVVAVALVTAISNLPYFRSRRIYAHRGIDSAQSKREWQGVLLAPTDAAVLVAFILLGLIQFAAEAGIFVHVTTIFAMIVWVDLWMYVTHRMMHQSPLLWRIHRHHHLSKITQPVTAISFSFSEKFFFYSTGWLVGIAAISWIVPISLEGVIAYFSIYYFLSAASHGNTEYFRDHLEFLQSPAIHGMHHVKPSVNYGFWTTLYDRMFGTYKSPAVTKDLTPKERQETTS